MSLLGAWRKAIKDDGEFVLADRCYRLLSASETLDVYVTAALGDLLADWGKLQSAGVGEPAPHGCGGVFWPSLGGSPRSAYRKATAIFNRGVIYGRLGSSEKAVAEYTAVLQMPDVPAEQRAKALVNRGSGIQAIGRCREGSCRLHRRAANARCAAEHKAKALINRGAAYGELGDAEKAVADYAAVLQMPDAPAEQKANALVNRGVDYGQLGDAEKAVADYTAVLQMPDASAEKKAMALSGAASRTIRTVATTTRLTTVGKLVASGRILALHAATWPYACWSAGERRKRSRNTMRRCGSPQRSN